MINFVLADTNLIVCITVYTLNKMIDDNERAFANEIPWQYQFENNKDNSNSSLLCCIMKHNMISIWS